MGIQWGVPRQGCCADGFADVTWRLVTYELMERLCTLVQQDHGLGWICELIMEHSYYMEMLVGDDSWSS